MYKSFKEQQGVSLLSFMRLQSRLFMSKKLFFYSLLRHDEDNEIKEFINASLQMIKNRFNTVLKRKQIFWVLLKQIKHIKGRKINLLKPLNGQRTHTNAKTVKKLFSKNKI